MILATRSGINRILRSMKRQQGVNERRPCLASVARMLLATAPLLLLTLAFVRFIWFFKVSACLGGSVMGTGSAAGASAESGAGAGGRALPTAGAEPPHDGGDVCRGYDGVLRIRSGDPGAALGAVLFVYVVNHLLYAERHNLLPWVHLDGTSHRIYDPDVHGVGAPHTFRTVIGRIPSERKDFVPMDPIPTTTRRMGERRSGVETVTVTGNGVWESYFDPVSAFSPARNATCGDRTKPLYELDLAQVATGLHSSVDWGVRAWPYGIVTDEERRTKTLEEWYRPMRRRAAAVVRRYYRPKAWLRRAAQRANPLGGGERCMAMHVRATDKELSGGRREIELSEYLPHVTDFLDGGGRGRDIDAGGVAVAGAAAASDVRSIIYLATDSGSTLTQMKKQWPPEVMSKVRAQPTAVRSGNETPTFDLASHHRTNTEVLIDIYAMAKCDILIHGRSAVSEAVMYLNADLRERSIDLDIPELK